MKRKVITDVALQAKKVTHERSVVAAIRAAGTFESCTAYNMPAFRYKGELVAGFLLCRHHLGFYPCSGGIVSQFKKELAHVKTSPGAVQFPYSVNLPKALIKKMVKARMKEIDQKMKVK